MSEREEKLVKLKKRIILGKIVGFVFWLACIPCFVYIGLVKISILTIMLVLGLFSIGLLCILIAVKAQEIFDEEDRIEKWVQKEKAKRI